MDMVKQTRPLWLLMENVVAARKGKNFERLNEDLTNEGYVCMDVELNAQESGLPQDRQRAYFSAIAMGIASSTDPFQFSALVD
jgi:site-specific DNA-cytosine methylase